MKYWFTGLLLLNGLCSFAQLRFKCTYIDSSFLKFPDSSLPTLVKQMREGGLPDSIIAGAVIKLKSGPVVKTRKRHVDANEDSTFIQIEVSEEGSLRKDVFETEYFLLKKNQLYCKKGGWEYDSLVTTPRKTFVATGRKPICFNFTCYEYSSTDMRCTIWVAGELPSCINPGIIVGDIKGAVLFYELRSNNNLVRCRITNIVQVIKKRKR